MADMQHNTPLSMPPQLSLAVLDWYAAAGVDVCVDDFPADRYAETQQQIQAAKDKLAQNLAASRGDSKRGGAPQPVAASAPIIQEAALLQSARTAASQANSLQELQQAMQAYDGCSLKITATQIVFADGNPDSSIAIVGEAPGQEEDRRGLPFVGRSGQLLDKMLASIGVTRENAYILNTVPWRPPGNRKPSDSEVALMEPFLHRHIALLQPKILLLVGGLAGKTLLQSHAGITRQRGSWGQYQYNVPEDAENPVRRIPALPIFHPAYLLRTPAQKKLAWQDLLAFRQKLQELAIL
jgi:DNA polymerase